MFMNAWRRDAPEMIVGPFEVLQVTPTEIQTDGRSLATLQAGVWTFGNEADEEFRGRTFTSYIVVDR